MRYIVRAVPERGRHVRLLREQIPQLEIVFDDGSRHAMRTFCRALEAAGDDPAVHMEDDAQLCPDFTARCEAVIVEKPGEVIQFFSRVKDDLTKGSRWIGGKGFRYNICFYLPAGMSRAIRAYHDRWPDLHRWPDSHAYDNMMQDYFVEQGMRFWNHVPSLVQHAEGPSAIGGRARSRQSQTFIDAWLKGAT